MIYENGATMEDRTIHTNTNTQKHTLALVPWKLSREWVRVVTDFAHLRADQYQANERPGLSNLHNIHISLACSDIKTRAIDPLRMKCQCPRYYNPKLASIKSYLLMVPTIEERIGRKGGQLNVPSFLFSIRSHHRLLPVG
jgi:hypothetical protein